jgi:hypothetical protein
MKESVIVMIYVAVSGYTGAMLHMLYLSYVVVPEILQQPYLSISASRSVFRTEIIAYSFDRDIPLVEVVYCRTCRCLVNNLPATNVPSSGKYQPHKSNDPDPTIRMTSYLLRGQF